MRVKFPLCCACLLFTATLMQADTLIVGTPANSLLASPTGPSPNLGGILINFDNLTSFTTFPSYTADGVTISSPDGLEVLPYSTQSSPMELFDDSSDGTANIRIDLAFGADSIGVGIADSDPVSVILQALNAQGMPFGTAFVENLALTQNAVNIGNSYFVIKDTSADIFGLSIKQPVGNAAFSGLAIDDVQATPEPGTAVLCLVVIGLMIVTRALRKPLGRLGRHIRSISMFTSATALLALVVAPSQVNAQTITPIQHVVVIFGENISFDHYFGLYPTAVNPPGQPRFTALSGTPAVFGLNATTNANNPSQIYPNLRLDNPNLNPANGKGAANPFRLNRSQALTADQNHGYTPEQESFNLGAMDLFPLKTGSGGGTPNLYPPVVATTGLVMSYYDGNTVTGMWNYAQHFALSDNSYNSNFGPSTPGAINLISGQTNGINESTVLNAPSGDQIQDGVGGWTLIGDAEPLHDVCSNTSSFNVELLGKNIGDLLNNAELTWGWFQGGFDLTVVNPNGTTGCHRSTVSPITGLTEGDYVEHHEPFQYYASTRNPMHLRPTGPIGTSDQAKHQYDTRDFFDALSAGNLPAVSFLKAQSYQDAHPGNSNPLDEQAFVVNVINTLQMSPFWDTTAVIIAYDDSDGWYDHQQGPINNASFSTADALSGSDACGLAGTTPQLPGVASGGFPVNGRCGPGVRTPLMVISPWAKPNYVDHTLTIQTSISRFIEDNWDLGRIGQGSFDATAGSIENMFDFSQSTPQNTTKLILSPTTGLPQ
jgi:phospholipase C